MLAALLAAKGLVEVPKEERERKREEAAATRKKEGESNEGGQGSAERSIFLLAIPVLAFSFTWACTRTCFHAYFPLLLAQRYGLPVTHIGWVLTTVSLVIILFQVRAYEPCRKFCGLSKTLGLGGLLVVFGLAALCRLPLGAPIATVLATSSIYGIGSALITAALPALLVSIAPKGRCGTLLGIESAVVNFGRIIAPPIFGVIVAGGTQARHLTSPPVIIGLVAVVLLVWRRSKARRK